MEGIYCYNNTILGMIFCHITHSKKWEVFSIHSRNFIPL